MHQGNKQYSMFGVQTRGKGRRFPLVPSLLKLEPRSRTAEAAFTLLELLVVIAIIGILTAIAVPTLNAFRPNLTQVAARQLLDDIAHARQIAISQRTTVYMVFCPSNFWSLPGYSGTPADSAKLYDKQLVGYALVSLRDVGDQPGRPIPRYWTAWKTLPEGVFIPWQKFTPGTELDILTNNNSQTAFRVRPFSTASNIPFPTEESLPIGGPFATVPYIGFNYLGQLTTNGPVPPPEEDIPIGLGVVGFARDPATKLPVASVPTIVENPIGNLTNSYRVVKIEGITGRAHVEKQEVQ